MKSLGRTRIMRSLGAGILGGMLLFLPSPSRTEPFHAWNDNQAVIEPQVPPPQGRLEVYSESYVMYDAKVPRNIRRPVIVYDANGQLVASEPNPLDEGPLHFDVTPGHYVIVSESHMQGRRVEADVQDGRTTVVPESAFEHAPLLASSPPQTTKQLTAQRSDPSH